MRLRFTCKNNKNVDFPIIFVNFRDEIWETPKKRQEISDHGAHGVDIPSEYFDYSEHREYRSSSPTKRSGRILRSSAQILDYSSTFDSHDKNPYETNTQVNHLESIGTMYVVRPAKHQKLNDLPGKAMHLITPIKTVLIPDRHKTKLCISYLDSLAGQSGEQDHQNDIQFKSIAYKSLKLVRRRNLLYEFQGVEGRMHNQYGVKL